MLGQAEPASAGRVVLADAPALTLGDLRIEPSLRRVARADGREQIVEPRVMQVLVALILADGRILSRDELLTRCWHGVVVGDDAINRVIGRLRRLADGLGGGAFKLETVTKVGFRLVKVDHIDEPPPPSRAADRANAALTPGLAVLPFDNMSTDPEQEYFSDGITEDIITDLSKISALRVIARNTSFTFRGHIADVRQVGQELNVSHILEGSVRKAGGRVRITAQLVTVADGVHIWAERWDRELTNIFAIQDEISQAVVGALKLRLLPEEKKAIEHRGTASPDAYNLYLMARRYRAGGNEGDPGREETIIRLSRRATDIDPNYAQAWALMANSQSLLCFNYRRGGDDGLAAAERALALDPALAEAHAVRARHLTNLGRPEEASAELTTALRLEPDSWEANKQSGLFNFHAGRFEDAIRYYRKASELMESDFSSPMMLFNCYSTIGETDSARQAARLTRTRAENAVKQDQSNGSAMATGCLALAFLGEREEAKDWARRARLVDPNNMVMHYNLACALSAYLNDVEGAVEILTVLFAKADGFWLDHARIDPELDAIRNDPRFKAIFETTEARLKTRDGA